MPDDLISPDWGGLYETLELARLMERPGWTTEQAARTLRHFAQAEVVYPHAARPERWSLSSGAACVALKALVDGGVADRTVTGHASVGLWAWQQEQSARS